MTGRKAVHLFQDYHNFNKVERYHQWSGYGKQMSGIPFMELNKVVGYILDYARESSRAEADIKVLDIGCGTGSVSIPLASLGFSVKGIDIDEESIRWAKQHNPFKNAEFEVGDAERLEIQDKFDVILCASILEHLVQPDKTLVRCANLLKNDGILVIVVPNGYGFHELTNRYILPLSERLGIHHILKALTLGKVKMLCEVGDCHSQPITLNMNSPHVNFFTLRKLKSLLATSNFTIVSKEHSNVVSGTRPLSFVFRRRKLLEYIDWKIADILPSFLVSGWYVICRPSLTN
jgi:ubiquinone biosynthesis O-methyltransferase